MADAARGSTDLKPFTALISAETLAAHLHEPRWVALDCRFSLTDPQQGRRRYARAHLPGAHYAHLAHDLAGPVTADSGRHPLPDPRAFARRMQRWGITPQSQVVVYDDGAGAFAARLWWMLRAAGHAAVALLDGGVRGWNEAGGELTADLPPPAEDAPAAAFTDFDTQPQLTTAEVERALAARHIVLLDARAAARYRGEHEPLDARAGHIPGASNLPFEHNLGADGRFLPAAELAARFAPAVAAAGGDASAVVHTCGSGVTACHNLLAMEAAGLSGSALYVGSWSEWLRNPDRAIATGPS